MVLALLASTLVMAGGISPAEATEDPPAFVTQWGTLGSGNSQFDTPRAVAVGGNGNVYVADSYNDRVQKFDSTGTYLTQWGADGSGDGQFGIPGGIATDPNDNSVYVADTNNHRVQKFDSTGTYLTQWGTDGSGDGQFHYPWGVAVDGNGDVYVADTNNHRVQKFDSTGTYLTQWGADGSGDGQFSFPGGIATDPNDNSVYVADSFNHRVQKFDSTGTYLTQWGADGYGDSQFHYPFGVAVDGNGNVYVVGSYNHRVQKFDSTGTYLTQWGMDGSDDGQFHYPFGVAVDGNRNVYVADQGNNRVQKFGAGDPPPDVFKYVALGDSFSAGEGIEPFFSADDGNLCHRSEFAYSTLVEEPGAPGQSVFSRQAGGDAAVEWGFQACSGAVAANVVGDGNNGDPLAQLDPDRGDDTNPNDLPVDEATDLVTITIGGNNLHFSDIVKWCFFTADCTAARLPDSDSLPGGWGKRLHRYLRELRNQLSSELDEVYSQINAQAPEARILVLGYPQLFPASTAEQGCSKLRVRGGRGWGFTTTEQNYLRQAASEANQLIAARVEAAGLPADVLTFVPVDGTFAGHEICGRKGEWINGPTITGSPPGANQQSFHPNEDGQTAGYAVAVNDVLNPGPRPDGRIRIGRTGTRVGDNIYNTTGQRQTRWGLAPGNSITYFASFRNCGPTAGEFQLTGDASQGGSTIQYRHDGVDITDQVVAGTYATSTLASGSSELIEITVTGLSTTGSPSSLTSTLTGTSTETGRQDTVRFRTT